VLLLTSQVPDYVAASTPSSFPAFSINGAAESYDPAVKLRQVAGSRAQLSKMLCHSSSVTGPKSTNALVCTATGFGMSLSNLSELGGKNSFLAYPARISFSVDVLSFIGLYGKVKWLLLIIPTPLRLVLQHIYDRLALVGKILRRYGVQGCSL
jgi:hypothetical protein